MKRLNFEDKVSISLSLKLADHNELKELSVRDVPPLPEIYSQMFLRLQVSETRLHNYMHNFPGIFYSQRPDFSFSYVGPGFLEKFSLEPQLVTKNGNQFLRLIYDKDRDYFLKEIENNTHTDETLSLSYRIRRPDEGNIIYITDVRTAHRSRSGLLLGYEGVLLDNSWQLIAENRLTSTAWKETLANITSGLVHDFSNIMSGIYSLSELYHSLINEKHPWAHGINQIKKNSMEAQNLVRRIIDLNRDLNGQRNIHNIENLIRDQLDLIQVVISKNTHLRTEFTGEELPVYIDEVSFRQVLLNLTLNARDALENNGEIAIAVKKVKEGETVF